MDRPTAKKAQKELEPLVEEWTLEAIPPGGEHWPGEARATIEWHDSGAHLVQRSIVGRWQKAEDGTNYETDFDLIYRRIK